MGVLENSRADVSFIAGLLVAGFNVTRPWLMQVVQQGIALLETIYQVQLASILQSRVKLMDETPIKAGQAGKGKLKASYFWPIYGEQDEVCFPWFESRRYEHVEQLLGTTPVVDGVLLSVRWLRRI